MKYTKPFQPSEDSFISSLNDSIAIGRSFPSIVFQPTANLKLSKPPGLVRLEPSTLTSSTNAFNRSINQQFPVVDKKLSMPEHKGIYNVSEKTGYNFISVLKEYTDQARINLSFEYTPQINSFLCICHLNKQPQGQGKGSNKQEAKKEASKQTIVLLLKENKQNVTYFSKFLSIEKGAMEEGDVSINPQELEKDADNEFVVYLNQFCQQKFCENPSFVYEPSNNGYKVIMKCGTYEEVAEGASKKLARQAAAKILCEKLALTVSKNSIDEIEQKCQKIYGTLPIYSQFYLLKDMIAIKVTCGPFTEEGSAKNKKEAKNSAAERMLLRLSATGYKENVKDKENELNFLDELGSEEEFVQMLNNPNKENVEKLNISGFPNNVNVNVKGNKPLADITNKRNKYQEVFFSYAEDKLSKILPNPIKDKLQVSTQKSDSFKDYDRQFLQPKEKDQKKLEDLYTDVQKLLISISSSLSIERFMPVGSYLSNSLRSYKMELDVLAIYDVKSNASNNILSMNKEILDRLKEAFLKEMERLDIEDKYELMLRESRGGCFLQISLEDNFKVHDIFHIIKIIPCSKVSAKLQMMLKINMEMMKTLDEQALKCRAADELKVVRRILRYFRDNKWPELKGEIVDIVVYNITRKFSEIDIIRNIKRFFEFIALGGLSCNNWFWEEFPEIFFDYIQTELSKDIKNKLETDCKEIVLKGVDSMIKLNP